jgi:hypothetical protein
VIIRDLPTGIETSTSIADAPGQFVVIGNIRWANDGEKLAFLADTGDMWETTYFLDIPSMELKELIKYGITKYIFDGWTSTNYLRYMNGNRSGYKYLDPKTGQFLPLDSKTPTP